MAQLSQRMLCDVRLLDPFWAGQQHAGAVKSYVPNANDDGAVHLAKVDRVAGHEGMTIVPPYELPC